MKGPMDSLRSTVSQLAAWLAWLPDPLIAALIFAVAGTVALLAHRWLRKLTRRLLAGRYPNVLAVVTQLRGLSRLAILILAIAIAVPVAPIEPTIAKWLSRLLLMAVICMIGWAAITALNIAAEIYLRRFRLDVDDNLLARKHNTQVRVLLRTAEVLIALITVGVALTTFDAVRQYGVSLFASAGLAGVVAGLAARPVLANLIAGVQLAVTQPVRIDDAVVVEGEWGTIEEITATYVVVKLWDLRRLIVPLSHFIEKPFQNWTRDSTALIGAAIFFLDYRAPIDRIRQKLEEICRQSKNWNGRTVALQVTDTKESTIEVRALMSADSAGQLFDLRCEVREQIVDFLQREHPEALPRERIVVVGAEGRLREAAEAPAPEKTAARR
jgi:small-conductance mechanosensitive channel